MATLLVPGKNNKPDTENEPVYKQVDRVVQKRRKREKIFYIINCIGWIIIFGLLIFNIWNYEPKSDNIETNNEFFNDVEDDDICIYVAEVKKVVIAPKIIAVGGVSEFDAVYIVDTDDHIFTTSFDPELLLLDEGEYIKVFFFARNQNSTCIPLDKYDLNVDMDTEQKMIR